MNTKKCSLPNPEINPPKKFIVPRFEMCQGTKLIRFCIPWPLCISKYFTNCMTLDAGSTCAFACMYIDTYVFITSRIMWILICLFSPRVHFHRPQRHFIIQCNITLNYVQLKLLCCKCIFEIGEL